MWLIKRSKKYSVLVSLVTFQGLGSHLDGKWLPFWTVKLYLILSQKVLLDSTDVEQQIISE